MENTKKSKKVLKVVTAVSSLALVGAVSFGATFAYLQANTNTKINTFTGGNVDITVDETFPGADINKTVTYTPGSSFDKEPHIDVNIGSEDAYLAATVTFEVQTGKDTYTKVSYEDFIASYGKIEGLNTAKWFRSTDAGDKSAVFYYGTYNALTKVVKPTTENTHTEDIFTDVVINQGIAKIDVEGTADTSDDVYPQIKITVDGYAVQADNLDGNMAATEKPAKTQLDSLITAAHSDST